MLSMVSGESADGVLFGPQLMNLIAIISVACAYNPYVSQAGVMDFVASTGIVIAVILGVLYVFHLREKVAQLLRLNFSVRRAA